MGNLLNSKKERKKSISLSWREIAMLSANTKYNEKEIRKWHSGFMKDCPNGKLNKKKFVQIYRQMYSDGNPDKFADYAFRVFDTDHSGEIDFTEFLLAIAVHRSGNMKAKLELAFEMCDADRNGTIDQRELTQILTAIHELTGGRLGVLSSPGAVASDVFRKADLNNDSKISREEFVYICMNDQRVRQLLAPNV